MDFITFLEKEWEKTKQTLDIKRLTDLEITANIYAEYLQTKDKWTT